MPESPDCRLVLKSAAAAASLAASPALAASDDPWHALAADVLASASASARRAFSSAAITSWRLRVMA